jgi:hemoglobin-like flavoprotein
MTPQQVDLVQRSWRAVLPVGGTAAELFYGKLFSLDPPIQGLFRDDLREHDQRRRRFPLASVQQLGKRHAGYGVEPRHYQLVEVALLFMLEHVLAGDLTADVREAWTVVSIAWSPPRCRRTTL